MSDYKYNPWPIGQIPKELQRPEPDKIKEMGYQWEDPRDIIDIFEKKVAEFAGSKYAVAVDCCTHAMELSLRYLIEFGDHNPATGYNNIITIPDNTYISAVQFISELGFYPQLEKIDWKGVYQLGSSRVWDSAVRWTKGMYLIDQFQHDGEEKLYPLQCLSFQIKKRIPIGRGGMVLCNDIKEYTWLKLASYDGRDLKTPYTAPDHLKVTRGFHYYMTPEDAARGIILMDNTPEVNEDTGGSENYPSIRQMLDGYGQFDSIDFHNKLFHGN